MKLYEITPALIDLASMDQDDEAVKTTLECVQMDFNDKALAILAVTANFDSDVAALDAEMDRLKARKQSIVNRKQQLRDYLLYNMEASGITKIESPIFTASIRKGVESVEIENESLIPDDYIKVEVLEKPDKAAIKKAIQSGQDVPGALLKRGANTIVIK